VWSEVLKVNTVKVGCVQVSTEQVLAKSCFIVEKLLPYDSRV